MRRSTRRRPNDVIGTRVIRARVVRARVVRARVVRTVVVLGLVGAGCQAADDDAVDTDTTIEVPMTQPTSGSTPPVSTDGEPEPAPTPSDDNPATPGDTTTSSLPEDVLDTTPDRTSTTPATGATETVYEVGTIDDGLAPFIAIAVDDLAARLDVQTDSIDVLTAVLVVWPNGAIGCPEPGRSYTQVTTDGSVIELGVDGVVYRYHSGGSLAPFPCDRPLDPVPSPA
jgi:hypothetical protein